MAQVEIIAANHKNNIRDSVKKIIKKVCVYRCVSTDQKKNLSLIILKHPMNNLVVMNYKSLFQKEILMCQQVKLKKIKDIIRKVWNKDIINCK